MEIRADIDDLMSKCVGCGQCVEVCTSHAYGGCNPLEVMEGRLESARGCLGCGLCERVCQYTRPKKVMMYAACRINSMSPPQVYRDTGYNLPPSEMVVPGPHYVKGADVQLMPGCMVVGSAPYLEYATERVLDFIGIPTERYDGGCCTYPVPFRGLDDTERDSIKRKGAEPLRGRKLYAICSGCAGEMVSSGIDCEHVVYVLHKNRDRLRGLKKVGMRVAIQPGCSLRTELPLFREILEAAGYRVVQKDQGCCGKLIPGISERIMTDRQESMKDVDAVVVGCPSCFARYNEYPDGIPVLYLTEAVLLAMGDRSTADLHRNPISR